MFSFLQVNHNSFCCLHIVLWYTGHWDFDWLLHLSAGFYIFLSCVYTLNFLPLMQFVNVICYFCCHSQWKGNTVAAMGSYTGRGLKQVRRIVEDCMKNLKHPVYHIKVTGFSLLRCYYYVGMLTRKRFIVAYWLLLNYTGTPNQTRASQKSCSSHWKLG